MSAPAFAAYDLFNVTTGIALYRTFATPTEILAANDNLRNRISSKRVDGMPCF